MIRRTTAAAFCAIVAGVLAAGDLAAQAEISARTADVRFGGRLHSQIATSSAEGGKELDFFTRRARLTLDVSVNDFLTARVQPDFGGSKLDLKDAYFRMNFDSGFRLWVGQFKRAFDLFELNSSTDIVVVERTGRVNGLSACAGPGGVCSLSRFTEKLGYSDRDIGLKADGSIGDRLSYQATITNGTGTSGSDENSGKSIAGRVSVELTDGITLSGNVSHHDFEREDGTTGRGTGFGGDLEIGSFRDGTHLQVGVIGGDNWLAEDPTTGDDPSFLTAQAILSHYAPVNNDLFEAVEPMARISWGDPNRDGDDDGGILFTPGVFIYVLGKNRIGANLDVYSPQSGDTEFSFKLQTYLFY